MAERPSNRLKLFGAIGVFVIGIAVLTRGICSVGLQERNMAKAREHAQLVNRRLRENVRLEHVEASEFTMHDGCLLVSGYVVSESDLENVRVLVQNSDPPTFVKYDVQVVTQQQLEEILDDSHAPR